MSEIPEYKVLLVGDTGEDEWSFLRRWKDYAYAAYNDPIFGLKTYPVQFTTNSGKKQLNLVSIPRRDVYSFENGSLIYHHVDAVILMIDDTRFNNAWRWHLKLLLADIDIPIVSCIISRSVDRGMNAAYKASSSRALFDGRGPGMSFYQRYRPLLWLIRKLCADPQIDWTKPLLYSAPPSAGDSLSRHMDNMTLSSTSSRTGSRILTPDSTQSGSSQRQDHISRPGSCSVDNTEYFHVFVLCIHCIRMILVKSPTTGRLAGLFPRERPYSLVTAKCRWCDEISGRGLPYNVLKHTRIYDVAQVVAGQHVEILLSGDNLTKSTKLDKLSDKMDKDCRIYGIRMDDDTIARLDELEAEDLWLEYVPGAFL